MVKNRPILLDTCVVIYLLSKEKALAKATADFLLNLGNNLYVSEYTHYELLRSIDNSKKSKAQECLKPFTIVPTSTERLNRATQLYSSIKNEESTKNFISSISDIDIFIGSLIFTDQKPVLLTADFNDFPRPFFKEVEYKTIEYKKNNGKKSCQYYYFLEADLNTLF